MATVQYGEFEWDETKAAANVRKHGVTFEEAVTAFADDWSIDFSDLVYPERFNLIGMSQSSKVLYIVYAEKLGKGIIRIISARRATRVERRRYEEEA